MGPGFESLRAYHERDYQHPFHFRRDGRVVDCIGLENRRTERYRGFESLSLRWETFRVVKWCSAPTSQKVLKQKQKCCKSLIYNTFYFAFNSVNLFCQRWHDHQLTAQIGVCYSSVSLFGVTLSVTQKKYVTLDYWLTVTLTTLNLWALDIYV